MGSSSSSEVKPNVCDNCKQPFIVYIPNACKHKFCLQCFLNHFQTCSLCFTQNGLSSDETHKEIINMFGHVNSQIESKGNHIAVLENRISEIEYDANVLNERQRREIDALTEQIKQLQVIISQTVSQKAANERTTVQQKKEINTMTEEIKRFQTTVSKMTSEKAAHEHEATQLKREKIQLEKFQDSASTNLVRLQEKITMLEQENEKLKNEAKLTDTSIKKQLVEKKKEKTLVISKSKSKVYTEHNPNSEMVPVNFDNSNGSNYFFDMKHNENSIGRIVIQSLPNLAPNMCRVFDDFVNGKGGTYLWSKIVKTCNDQYIVFQNAFVNGTTEMYSADKNDLKIKRGAVGMRVQGLDSNGQKLVKSQFYVLLTDEMPSDGLFSYVFGYVSEGFEVCEAISNMNSSEKIMVGDLGVLA